MSLVKNENGELPAYAWPGGYPMFYVAKDSSVLCPTCANQETENIEAGDANWEDPDMHCDQCTRRIESAYAED